VGTIFTTLDLVVFFVAVIGVMTLGLVAGRREDTAEDFFLAGRKIPWWGVAGSIYGSNVSANHMVGMMGVGFGVGFAQSHFELGAIAGLMLLCYGFLPVYRKLKVATLSEYLGRRYDDRSRGAYAVIMVIIMAVVQMAPALYIGGRSICVLVGGDAVEPIVDETTAKTTLEVNDMYYASFVIALAVIAASYTIFGGLTAVIWTDVIQSMLLLAAGILVAVLTFNQLGGWGAMIELDRAELTQKMHLYLPSTHGQLPWTGVLTGLMVMHFFYWGTNQFIVQRALAARSDHEARLGIVAAGYLKLLIPFFAIGTGVAAFYLFKQRMPERTIDSDTAFTELVKLVVQPGFGIVGLISAGLIGAILSSIDSMMNSAATIVTYDLYQRYINPQASERRMILVGRLSIAIFITLAALLAIFMLDPNSKEHFFLKIANYQNYFTPGLLVAFFLGIFWRRSTANAAFLSIVSGVFFSWLLESSYNRYHADHPGVSAYFGTELNFLHRVGGVVVLCTVVHVVVSLLTKADPEKARLTWTDLGGHDPRALGRLMFQLAVLLGVFAILGYAIYGDLITPAWAAAIGAGSTFGMFQVAVAKSVAAARSHDSVESTSASWQLFLRDDRFWAGLLCSLAVFMMYYYC